MMMYDLSIARDTIAQQIVTGLKIYSSSSVETVLSTGVLTSGY